MTTCADAGPSLRTCLRSDSQRETVRFVLLSRQSAHPRARLNVLNLPVRRAHRSAPSGAKMRQKCALGRFWAEDQSVARRSWREGCGGAAFGENAGGRGYRVFSMACARLIEAPSDGDRWRFVSAFRAAHTFVISLILHASLVRHSCATYATVRAAFQVGGAEIDGPVVLGRGKMDC